jgi:hypothetical protein
MRKKQFETICNKLLPHLPGFACNGWLLYATPVGHVLRGFCCDPSGFDRTRFTVVVFALPSYVPAAHLSFTFGHRLKDNRGCDYWWDTQDTNLVENLLTCIVEQGLPFLAALDDPKRMVELAKEVEFEGQSEWLRHRREQCLPMSLEEEVFRIRNPYVLEAIAYSEVVAEDYGAAETGLSDLVKQLDKTIPWQGEMLERANVLKAKLNSAPQEAKQLLLDWEKTTLRNLGLGEGMCK